jgi:hypothetical protein
MRFELLVQESQLSAATYRMTQPLKSNEINHTTSFGTYYFILFGRNKIM